ncbi:MAG TPA: LapA family protein [Casimicrobiaceae bacterium]|nr:LapA family protein [Casimicrobiaceae bacterium]
MTLLRWIVGFVLFLALLVLALKNDQRVQVWFYGWTSSEVPLIFLLLVAFAIGVTSGLMVGAMRSARLKRQLNRLRKDHAKHLATSALPPADGG